MATSTANSAPLARAAVRRYHPRQEPSAVVPHAGICAGGGRQRPSLPQPIPAAPRRRMRRPCPIGRDPKGSPCRCPADRPWTGPTTSRHPRISGGSRMLLGRLLAVAAAGMLAAAAPAQAAKVERLSRPGKTSYFAFVDKVTAARKTPGTTGKTITKLSLKTPVGTANLVLVLDRTVVKKRAWLRVRLPVRPNNTTGWVL